MLVWAVQASVGQRFTQTAEPRRSHDEAEVDLQALAITRGSQEGDRKDAEIQRAAHQALPLQAEARRKISKLKIDGRQATRNLDQRLIGFSYPSIRQAGRGERQEGGLQVQKIALTGCLSIRTLDVNAHLEVALNFRATSQRPCLRI